MKFKGTDSPSVYIIDFQEEENSAEEYPMSGARGDYVFALLGSFGILDKVRCANIKVQGYDTVLDDIIRTQPKVVITFGSGVLGTFVTSGKRISDISGSVYDVSFKGYTTKLLAMVSPTYILHRLQDNNTTLKFTQDLYKAFQIVNGNYKDILAEKEILSAHSFEEFLEIYNTRFLNDTDFAYDIETNARPPMMEDSKIIGFSIANKTSGVYVSLDSLDFHMEKEEEDRIWDFIINEVFEKKHKLVIHNTMYERPYTLCCKGYEIGYDKADDTLVMARLLRSPKENAGLKYQAQKYIHYPDWETDLSRYIGGINWLINRVGLGPKKFVSLYEDLKTDLFGYKNHESFDKLCAVDKEEVSTSIERLKSTIVDCYSEEEVRRLSVLIMEKVQDAVNNKGVKDSTIPYNWIPDRVLSKYGAVDSIATFDLRDFFFDKMDKESTDKVDLHKGYENWLEHMYIAYIMERNGMYWDDNLVQKDRDFLSEQATKCLRSLLMSPLFEKEIVQLCQSRYRPIILSDYLPEIALTQGYEVNYDAVLKKYTIKYNGKRAAQGKIVEILIPEDKQAKYESLVKTMFYEEVKDAVDFEELKELYNPSSSTESYVAKEILLTDRLQMGGRIVNLHTFSKSPKNEDIKSTFPAIDQKFLQIADLLCTPDKLKEMYGDEWAKGRKDLYNGFCTLYKTCKKSVTVPEIRNILKEKEPVQIDSLDDTGIIAIYDNLVVTGMDPDDKTSWIPEFEWMVNYRIFKKSAKLITSYIDGSVGRESVAIVDKESVQSGSHCVFRKRNYNENPLTERGKYDNLPTEDFLLMAKWGPNTAETGRWRSAQHTVPWNSPIKKYYRSRFVGGTTVCPDYSQMEVRTLGAVAQDENMLDLFRRGDDFHTETAKKIFRKDEVTPAERRFSKAATFSLLYGSSVKSFASKYCEGDMDYANMIFNGFFEAYPKVKEWITKAHEEAQRDHRVSLELSNRFIPIIPADSSPGEMNHILRMAQNYPIQGQSADLTGGVIFDLQKWIEENNLKSLIFMYVHDSIEVDIYPYELLQFISKLKVLLNESPQRRMGLPSKADVALGKSLGDEIELEDIQMNEDMTEGWLHLKGYKDEIDETIENWKQVYKTVEVEEENYEDVFVSMGELFIPKKAYTPTLGTTRQVGTCVVHIDYYNH